MSRDGKVAAIDVIDQGGEGQQRDYRARTAATLVVSLERQVLSVDILSACRGTGKQLLVAGRGIRPAVPTELINLPEGERLRSRFGNCETQRCGRRTGRNIRRRAPACRAGAPQI